MTGFVRAARSQPKTPRDPRRAPARARRSQRGVHNRHRGLFRVTFPTRRAMISCSDSSAAFKISNCSGGMRPTDFTFGLHFLYLRRRRWPLLVTTVCFDESELTGLIETLDSMMLDRLGALPPPQRKDLRGLPLARDQSHDAAAPESRVGWAAFSLAGAAPCGDRWCAKRRRAYPGPTQVPFLAYPASARRRGSTDGYSLTHEPPG